MRLCFGARHPAVLLDCKLLTLVGACYIIYKNIVVDFIRATYTHTYTLNHFITHCYCCSVLFLFLFHTSTADTFNEKCWTCMRWWGICCEKGAKGQQQQVSTYCKAKLAITFTASAVTAAAAAAKQRTSPHARLFHCDFMVRKMLNMIYKDV